VRVKLDSGKVLRILSNDLEAPAQQIADLYKRRWRTSRAAMRSPRTSRAHAIAEARRRAANDSGWQRSRTERFADSPHQLHFSKASTAASGPASERESGAGMLPDLPRFSLGLHQGQHPSS
jgi:hypothetical protein